MVVVVAPFLLTMFRCCCRRQNLIERSSVLKDYELVNQIGDGKTGKVYLGRHRETKENFAIKVIKTEYLSTKSRINALEQEIEILSTVSHPSIVKLHKVHKSDQHVALVMELLTGGEVMERISAEDSVTISEAEICRIVKEIASVLVYLHSRGITHRDIKPENIIYQTPELGSPIKLVDFGVSHVGLIGGYDMTGMAGTGHFMAPETFSRNATYGSEIDIWSLGIMTYVMLFGCYPFDAPFLSQLEDQIIAGKFMYPQDLTIEVSKKAKNFIERLLVADIQARPLAVEVSEHPWLRTNGASTEAMSLYHRKKLRDYVLARKQVNAKLIRIASQGTSASSSSPPPSSQYTPPPPSTTTGI